MGTLFGIALGAGAEAAVDAYKTVSSVSQKWAEGDRDDRRVKIAENADKRAAASAAAAEQARKEAAQVAKVEAGIGAPAVSALAPEAPVGAATGSAATAAPAPMSVGAAPATSALTSVASDAREPEELIGGPGVVDPPPMRAGGPKTASGTLSGTETSRTGATGEAGTIARLRALGTVSAMNRVREMEAAALARKDKDREHGLAARRTAVAEGELAVRRAEVHETITDKQRARLIAERTEATGMMLGSIDEAMRTPSATPETSVTDPKVEDAVRRSMDMARRAHSLIPDRLDMTYDVDRESGAIVMKIKPKMGGEPTTRVIRNLGELEAAGRELSFIATNPEITAGWMRSRAAADYVTAATRRAAELAITEDSIKLKKSRDIEAARDMLPELRKEIEDVYKLKTSPDRAREIIRKMTELDREGMVKDEDIMATGPDGKPVRAGKKERNVWTDILNEAIPADKIEVPGPKKDEKLSRTSAEEAASITEKYKGKIKDEASRNELAMVLDKSLAAKGWTNPHRRSEIIRRGLASAMKPEENEPVSAVGSVSGVSGSGAPAPGAVSTAAPSAGTVGEVMSGLGTAARSAVGIRPSSRRSVEDVARERAREGMVP